MHSNVDVRKTIGCETKESPAPVCRVPCPEFKLFEPWCYLCKKGRGGGGGGGGGRVGEEYFLKE